MVNNIQRSTYWIGLAAMHELTKGHMSHIGHVDDLDSLLRTHVQLRIIVWDVHDTRHQYDYDDVRIESKYHNYRLRLANTTGGKPATALYAHDGAAFSTFDRDNDNSDMNCARWERDVWK
jgi:hypothetical protein